MIRLRSERIVTPAGTIAGELTVEDRRIADLRSPRPSPGGADVIDLGAHWIVPGYIDIHVHGGAGAQCNTEDPEQVLAVARFHAARGTTALLATTASAPIPQLEAALRAIARCSGHRGGATVLGAHLEGPFISPRRPGAMDPNTFTEPDPRLLVRLLAAGGGCVRVMTVAPELPGALELIRSVVGHGAVASVGHTEATYAQTEAAVTAGARSATHLFNAMRPLHHRDPGVIGAVLDLRGVSCELICDGVHVDPAVLRLAHRAKGTAGIALVTDAIAGAGMPDGEYRLGATAIAVTHGRAVVAGGDELAGSTLTMDAAVRNAVRSLGVDLQRASAMASANPARLLGLADRKGRLAPGFDADLVVLDDELQVRGTLVAGEWIAGPPG